MTDAEDRSRETGQRDRTGQDRTGQRRDWKRKAGTGSRTVRRKAAGAEKPAPGRGSAKTSGGRHPGTGTGPKEDERNDRKATASGSGATEAGRTTKNRRSFTYHKKNLTRIDSLKLCETEHLLHWGNSGCFKTRPRPARVYARRTGGRLRLPETPHLTILQIRQTKVRNPMRFFRNRS